MKEKLLQAKFQLEQQIHSVDRAIKFFEEHPEMDTMLEAYMAIMRSGVPAVGMY